jgi:glycosyltransferase involved in cell wall biosynthesis
MRPICVLLQNHYEIDLRVRRKAEALVAAGYSVDVLALRSPYSPSKNYTLDGVNLYTVDLGKKRGSILRYAYEYFFFTVWCFFKVASLMGKRHYAIIDTNNLPDFLVFASAYGKWKGAKVILDMHEITPEFYISKYGISPDSWKIKLLTRIEQHSLSFADRVININHPIENLLASRGMPESKSTIVMNSVDEEFFAASSASIDRVPALPSPPSFVMMYHGTLTGLYGLDIAVEAFALVHNEMPGAELWIVGTGPEKTALESLARVRGIEAKVKCVGRVLPHEIPHYLKQCDVGVLPTRQDVFLDLSFSSKLSEYIIMGKPVIASRLKTINYYFTDEALAFFEPLDARDLARQMRDLYGNTERRARLVSHAREQFAPIRWDVMRQRYLALVRELAGETARVEQPHPVNLT